MRAMALTSGLDGLCPRAADRRSLAFAEIVALVVFVFLTFETRLHSRRPRSVHVSLCRVRQVELCIIWKQWYVEWSIETTVLSSARTESVVRTWSCMHCVWWERHILKVSPNRASCCCSGLCSHPSFCLFLSGRKDSAMHMPDVCSTLCLYAHCVTALSVLCSNCSQFSEQPRCEWSAA